MDRMRLVALLATAGLALVSAACAGGPAPTPTPPPTPTPTSGGSGNAEEGMVLFQQSCSSCHGLEAEGIPGLGKDLRTSAFVKGLSDEELLAFIKQGRGVGDPANTTGVDMPPKGGNPALTDADLRAIIAYIRSVEE